MKKIVRTMQSTNRFDNLPEDLQKRIWTYYLADRLKKLRFLKDRLSNGAMNLPIPEPSAGARSVSNNLLILSEVCGVDALALRDPLENWWGPRCGHKLHLPSAYVPPWYTLMSSFFEIYGCGWVDVLCLDATHIQIEFAAKRASNVPLHTYKWALRKSKHPKASPVCIFNAKCTIENHQAWYPDFFGPLQDAKSKNATRIRAMKRKYQRTIDDKANDFVRRNS